MKNPKPRKGKVRKPEFLNNEPIALRVCDYDYKKIIVKTKVYRNMVPVSYEVSYLGHQTALRMHAWLTRYLAWAEQEGKK